MSTVAGAVPARYASHDRYDGNGYDASRLGQLEARKCEASIAVVPAPELRALGEPNATLWALQDPSPKELPSIANDSSTP